MNNSKSILTAFLCITFLFLTHLTSAQFSGGTGISNDPWLITTEKDFYNINTSNFIGMNNVDEPNIYFKLMNDITLNNPGVLPFGDDSNPFIGYFDGNDHSITIKSGGGSTLFGCLYGFLDRKATVENLTVFANGSNGMIALKNQGLIRNCYVYGIINTTSSSAVGALVNQNEGTIINCESYCKSVTGGKYTGGLVGDNGGGIITNCINHAPVSSSYDYIGGIVGANGGTIEDCSNVGEITINAGDGGGIAGDNNYGTILRSSNLGTIKTGTDLVSNVGGISGFGYGSIEECYNLGNITGKLQFAGGIIGDNYGSVINSYSICSIDYSTWNGSLIGRQINGTVTNCYSACYTKNIRCFADYMNGPVTNTYWDVDLAGYYEGSLNRERNDVDGNTRTTVHMKKQSNYAGWDFMQETTNGTNDIWGINPSVNNGYPFLKWQGYEHVNTFFANGEGTAALPYQITTPDELSLVRYYAGIDNIYFKIMNDIDLSTYLATGNGYTAWGNAGWMPIGNLATSFNGKIDGNGKRITGLFINQPTEIFVGLFGVTGSGCEIKNLQIELGETGITGDIFVGGIAGEMASTAITNCYVIGNISGNTRVGGLVGYTKDSNIATSFASGSINGNWQIGGLVGLITNGNVSNCYSNSSIAAEKQYTGGIAGSIENTTIANCYAGGSVSGTTISAGGFVGTTSGTNTFTNNFWNKTTNTAPELDNGLGNGLTSASMKIQASFTNWDFTSGTGIWQIKGSADGYTSYPFLRAFSYDLPEASAINPIPGLEKLLYAGTGTATDPYKVTSWEQLHNMRLNLSAYYILTNDLNTSSSGYNTYASATANSGEGWLPIGDDKNPFSGNFNGNNHTINGLTIIRPNNYFVGLFGFIKNASVSNTRLTNISVSGGYFVGSLSGTNSYALMSNASVSGSVNGYGAVGGLIGTNMNATLTNAYSTASVNGNEGVGGLAGNNSGKIENAYATGDVVGEKWVGGLVGRSLDGTVSKTYSTGHVTGTTEVGGLIGDSTWGTYTNNYWDKQTSGQSSSSNAGEGKTTAEMKSLVTYSGWDFASSNGTWQIKECSTTYISYPYLKALSYDLPETAPEVNPIPGLEKLLYSCGDGTSGNPYQITNWEQLTNIRFNPSAYFILNNNLDKNSSGYDTYASASANSDEGWLPIGDETVPFTGSLDGNNHIIDGLIINRDNTDGVGLFGYIRGASISSIGLTNSAIKGRDYVGSFAGSFIEGYIYNSFTTGSITGHNSVGGMVGMNTDGTIWNAYSTVNVTGEDKVGGLAGQVTGATFIYTYATGHVVGTTSVGGLAGYGISDNNGNNYWDTQTTGQSSSVIGTGKTTAEMKTVGTFSNWDFTSGTRFWKIREIADSYISYPFLSSISYDSPGTTPAVNPIPGLEKIVYAGGDGTQANPYQITNWEQLDNVRLNLSAYYILKNNLDANSYGYNTFASATANNNAGWLPIGDANRPFKGNFNGNYHLIDGLTVNRENTNYAGFCGYIYPSATISNIGLSNLNINGHYFVGALAGFNKGTITNAFASGNIIGYSSIGGLAGYNGGDINNCYATGSVKGNINVIGTKYIGGLVGEMTTGTVSNSFAAGIISGTSDVGGLIGFYAGGSINNSFWDIQLSQQTSSAGGTGKNTDGMKTISTYTGAGWSTSVWALFTEGVYPHLLWELPAVSTATVTTINSGSATIGGQVTSEGLTPVTERGLVYSLASANNNPLIGGTDVTKVVVGSGTGSFSQRISQLAPETTYNVNTYATNSAGTGYGSTTSFTTTAVVAPSILSVSVPSNGTYIPGQNLDFTVNYNEAITVNTSIGTPYIPVTLNTGGTVSATFISGGGTSSLVFRYTIGAGTEDTDGISVGNTIIANGGTISSTLENTGANLNLNSIGNTTAIFVDGIAPTVSFVSSATANGAYKLNDIISITITFSEAVTVTGIPTLSLNSGGTAAYTNGSETSAISFNYTVANGESSADLDYLATSSLALANGTINDVAGNNAILTLPTLGSANSLSGQKDILIAINPSAGGTIASDQEGFNPFSPDELTSVSLPTGHIGTLEYKWQSSTNSDSAGFIDVANSDTESYNPGTITATTWYRRLARVDCMADWTGAAESNAVKLTVNQENILDKIDNQTVCNGSSTVSVTFSGTVSGTTYQWTNDNPAIGLAASGTGNIPLFTALNSTNEPVTATITVTPIYEIDKRPVPELIYYKFDGTGTTVPNLASAPPTGTTTATLMGSLTQGPGLCNKSLIGSGNSAETDYLNTGWTVNLSDISWTISFKTANIIPSSSLLYVFGNANSNGFRCFTNGVAGPGNWMLRGNNIADVYVNQAATVAPHTITFVYNNTEGNIKAYVDGVLNNTVSQNTLTITETDFLKVMSYNTTTGLNQGGLLDEFRVYNRALSQNEVQGLSSCSLIHNSMPQTFTITVNPTPAAPTAQSNSYIYSGTSITASVNVHDGETVDWYAGTTGNTTTPVLSATNAGTYSAYAEARNITTGCLSASRTLTTLEVIPATLTVTANTQTKTYSEANPTLTLQYSGFKNNETETVLDTKPIASTTVDLLTNVGTYTNAITVSGGADNNYDLSYVPANFTVTKAALTVTAEAKTKTYSEANPTLTLLYSGFKNNETETVLDTKPTASTTVDLLTNAGTYTNAITISGGADHNYDLSYVPANFTVTKAALTVTAEAKTKTYSEANPTLTLQYSGFKNNETETVLDTKPTASTTVDLLTNVGTYTNAITVSGGADNNYALSYVPANFTVTKAALTVTAEAKTKTYSEANPTLTLQYSGFKNNETETVLDTKPTASTTVDLLTNAGTYTNAITVSGGVDNNYDLSYVPGNFTVTKAKQTIDLSLIPAKTYGDNAFLLEATTTSGLTLNYSCSDPTIATLSGNQVAITGAGSALITVSQAGNRNYEAATTNQTFTVNKKQLIIEGISAKSKEYDGNTIAELSGGQLVGLVYSDQLTLTVSPSGTFNQTSAGTNIPVSVATTITGEKAKNYQLVAPLVSANIVPKLITVTAQSVNVTCTQVEQALQYTFEPALIGNDTFDGKIVRAPGNLPGIYPITQGTLTLGRNYTISFNGANYSIANSVNLPPVVDFINDQKASKNSKEAVVTLTGIDPVSNCIVQKIESITAIAENQTLVPDIQVEYTAGQTTAKLKLKIADDQAGETKILVKLKDNGGSENNGIDTKEISFVMTIEIPTGINDLGQSVDAKVYPNPSSGLVYIETTGFVNPSVRIFNAAGKEILIKTSLTELIQTINLTNGIAGLYFIEISDNKKTVTKKLIIKN